MKADITVYGASRIKFLQDTLSLQDPSSMGRTDEMRRSILTGRLTTAFEAGWNARGKVANLTPDDEAVRLLRTIRSECLNCKDDPGRLGEITGRTQRAVDEFLAKIPSRFNTQGNAK